MASAYAQVSFIPMIGESDLITFDCFPADGLTADEKKHYEAHPEELPINWIIHKLNDHVSRIYRTDSAYDLFVRQPEERRIVPLDPFTRQPVTQAFVKRIKLYHAAVEQFGADYKYSLDELKTLFQSYINGEAITPENKLLLRRFLKIDDIIDIFPDMSGVESKDYRTTAESALETKTNKSWLVRPSSVTDSAAKIARVLTFKYDNKMYNMLIAHIYGFGYLYGIEMRRFGDIDTFDYPLLANIYRNHTFESLIDILDSVETDGFIDRTKYVGRG